MRRSATALVLLALSASCKFDSAYRDNVGQAQAAAPCTEGVIECADALLVQCQNNTKVTLDDCGAKQKVCAPTLLKCTTCVPGSNSCSGFDVQTCSADGATLTTIQTCDSEHAQACRNGGCHDLCADALVEHSNVGCEYWGVDLDNAVTSQGNAAAQQYAVVISNNEPDLVANVTVEEDDAPVGMPQQLRTVGTARVGPHNLEVFKLGPREVDASAPGTFNTGTGTALSRGAYRFRSDVPIVAYQFNPLDNVNVFSNDASLLLPTAALGAGGGRQYVVAGWPQTIATSEDPQTDFGQDLRVFLAIVGTAPNTAVHVKTTAKIIPGGPLTAGVAKGDSFDAVIQPFEVLNLETGEFNADFTGSLIDSSGPVAVFVGSEASDAPYFSTLATRACCADHLEQQSIPLRAAGKRYVLGRVPNRTKALAAAGVAVSPFDEPEFYRVVAVTDGVTKLTTTLPAPYDVVELDGEGSNVTLVAHQDFTMTTDNPVHVADIQASQEAAGVVRGLPGGDPSLSFVPPVEQWRNDYVLLTPDKYAFDFLVVTAQKGSQVYIDGQLVDGTICELGAVDTAFVVYRCQLSFPGYDPSTNTVTTGRQNDGVHRVQSDYPVGVLVYGFDAFVSYAYAGGTELKDINTPK